MKLKHLSLLFILALLLVFAAACGGGNTEEDAGTTGTEGGTAGTETETEEATEATEATGETSGSVVISGSSAMQPLIAAAADEFMAANPEASIQVQAGGSGTGLSQVAEGAVDIGNSDVFAEEKEEIPADELVDHRVAIVGMTAAVNSEVGIDDLSKEDLIRVFTGEATNWNEVGGEDQEIVLVNRPDSSGTRATFVEYGLDGETPAEGVTEDSSNTVKKIISETPGAIGYLAFSYFTDETVTAVSVDGVEATDENVQSGEFPIWAYQHSYTNGEAEGLAKTFLDYLMSDEIQQGLVPDQGYIAATDMQVERDAEGNQTDI